jgi:hypothetical protein
MQLQWFGPSWGAPINEDCERVDVPSGEPCARCEQQIHVGDHGVRMWHVPEGYRPLHYACFMRGTIGGISHVLLHGTGGCNGECQPDPEWIPAKDAAEIALRLWQFARLRASV